MPDGHADRLTGPDIPALVTAPQRAVEQPPVLPGARMQMTAAVASLALGGAERIVLDWAARTARRHRVRVIVLRDTSPEWPVPAGIETVRLHGEAVSAQLERAGAKLAACGNPVVLCHLLLEKERAALARGGATPLPVLHNAADGWIEPAERLRDAPRVVCVSRSAAADARRLGVSQPLTVVHHYCAAPPQRPQARGEWRARWALPADALVIGMVGGVKPQKAYPRALRVLADLRRSRDAYLVIVGGPTGRDGLLAWRAVIAQATRLGVEPQVRLAGFVAGAADCLPAFDVVLNTSRYEGLSMATLEALAAGLPVVASAVGGQGEIGAPGLKLVPFDAPDEKWSDTVIGALGQRPPAPPWIGFPSDRLWTLLHIAQRVERTSGVLFVTANLNVGGAQRSLANLACALQASMRLEILVCGDSSSSAFSRALSAGGVRVHRSAVSRDCFDHAEAIVRHACAGHFRTVCFWNADPKVKLLVAKALAAETSIVDVSPGAYAFEEMDATRAFQDCIAYSADEYYARLARLVLKYRGSAPRCAQGVSVIPNGVTIPPETKARPPAPPRIVVSGRIAPSKFLLEIAAAMRFLWRLHPDAELHVIGSAEQRHADYARQLVQALGNALGRRAFLHGPKEDVRAELAGFTAALVLGEHQGCPNAVLEALAAGIPVVANDSGGTRELVIEGRTGLLLDGRDPQRIAEALARLIDDRVLAHRLARAGRRHVARRFSLARMVKDYRRLFA